MSYKVKRGSTPTDNSIKEILLNFIKRLVVFVIVLAVMIAIGYFLFQFAYDKFPVFATAADDVLKIVKDFYVEYGLWATLGAIVFICIAVWALGEEMKKKERRKNAMNEMMK